MAEAPTTLIEAFYEKGTLFGDIEQPKQSIYEESATQLYYIGTKLVYNDGRKFRYGGVGGSAIYKALMMQSSVMLSYMTAQTQTALTQSVGDQEITTLITTGSGAALDDFAQGFMCVDSGDAAAIGDIYRILSSKVGSTDTEFTLLLERVIRTALTASAVLTFVKNKYQDLIVVPQATGVTAPIAGVPLIDMTADYFGWFQTRGYAPLIVDTGEDINEGDPVGEPAAYAVDGTCGVQVTLLPRWGVCVHDAVAGAAAIIDLEID